MSLFALRGVGHVNTRLEYGMGIAERWGSAAGGEGGWGGGGSHELGSVGHIRVSPRQLGRSEGPRYQTPLLTG